LVFTIVIKALRRRFTALDKISRWWPNQCDHHCKVFEGVMVAVVIENIPK